MSKKIPKDIDRYRERGTLTVRGKLECLLADFRGHLARYGLTPSEAGWPGWLERPPSRALARCSAIPLLFDALPGAGGGIMAIKYDSWGSSPVPGLRDLSDGHIRRVTFGSGQLILEVVAERRRNRWEFVGRSYLGDLVTYAFVLRIGRRRLMPDSRGFYAWTSGHVPRKISLLSPDQEIACEGLSW